MGRPLAERGVSKQRMKRSFSYQQQHFVEVIAASKYIMEAAAQRPKVAEIQAHTTFPDTIWNLTPTQSGRLAVAEGRGGPINIDWEVHGTGDIKLVWIMGLGTIKSVWQRQTLNFGHEQGQKYSSLIFDNRGMGKSDKPLMRYSTSEMAKDLLELVNHLGWTKDRQLHVSGISMGGMIAQEFAYLVPQRIASLNLISTAAMIENTTTFLENLRTRILMFVPKSLDRQIEHSARMLMPDSWLDAPDNCVVPTSSTPNTVLPPSGKYAMFSTNYERYAAQEINKRTNKEEFTRGGFIMQAIAAGWHRKSAGQLRELGDKVGRERISVVHGTDDLMITVHHGRKLIEMLQPVVGEIKDGFGHVFMLQDTKWHDGLIEKMVERGEVAGKA